MKNALFAVVATLLLPSLTLAQSVLDGEVLALKQSWAQANYHSPDKAQKVQSLEALGTRAHALVERYPQKAEPLIWEGIVLSSYADAKGGLGALGAAKQAKVLFEQAIKLDERALDGSALASLGVLYSKVPGFPIGFGDDKKARQLLERAMAVNPDGIDSNYFYGEFLADHHDEAGARQHLQKALQAPARSGQEVADQGRRQQVATLLARLDKKI
ncbi:MAG: TRAP transporter TatT component family protein [Pseudomonadota bacterium]